VLSKRKGNNFAYIPFQDRGTNWGREASGLYFQIGSTKVRGSKKGKEDDCKTEHARKRGGGGERKTEQRTKVFHNLRKRGLGETQSQLKKPPHQPRKGLRRRKKREQSAFQITESRRKSGEKRALKGPGTLKGKASFSGGTEDGKPWKRVNLSNIGGGVNWEEETNPQKEIMGSAKRLQTMTGLGKHDRPEKNLGRKKKRETIPSWSCLATRQVKKNRQIETPQIFYKPPYPEVGA